MEACIALVLLAIGQDTLENILGYKDNRPNWDTQLGPYKPMGMHIALV